tara:strand:+ start:23917 stop:24177 length:261 start_codon:yes stop_codon:yes gene_type:complete
MNPLCEREILNEMKGLKDIILRKNNTIDMRYKENIKLFSRKYKEKVLLENRKHNVVINNNKSTNYRDEIINLTENEIMEFRNKIEV